MNASEELPTAKHLVRWVCPITVLEVPEFRDSKCKGFAQLPCGHIDQQGQQNVGADHRKQATKAMYLFRANTTLSSMQH